MRLWLTFREVTSWLGLGPEQSEVILFGVIRSLS